VEQARVVSEVEGKEVARLGLTKALLRRDRVGMDRPLVQVKRLKGKGIPGHQDQNKGVVESQA
jgi:hypothetical protein